MKYLTQSQAPCFNGFMATTTHSQETKMAYTPSPYGVESDIETLQAVQARQIAKCEVAAAQRTDSSLADATWRLEVSILDAITADLQAAEVLAGRVRVGRGNSSIEAYLNAMSDDGEA